MCDSFMQLRERRDLVSLADTIFFYIFNLALTRVNGLRSSCNYCHVTFFNLIIVHRFSSLCFVIEG